MMWAHLGFLQTEHGTSEELSQSMCASHFLPQMILISEDFKLCWIWALLPVRPFLSPWPLCFLFLAQGALPTASNSYASSSTLEKPLFMVLRKTQPGPSSSGKPPSLTMSHPVRISSYTAAFFMPVLTLHLLIFYLTVFPFSHCESSEDRHRDELASPHDSSA